MTTDFTFPDTWPGLGGIDMQRYAAAQLGDLASQAAIVAAQNAASAYSARNNALWYMQAGLQDVNAKPKPHARHSDPDWRIYPGANVQRTWARFGWKPTQR